MPFFLLHGEGAVTWRLFIVEGTCERLYQTVITERFVRPYGFVVIFVSFFVFLSLMRHIVNKCEEADSLIQRCQNNESALVEEKFNIRQLVNDVSALLTKCELEPVEKNNLTYYFEYDFQHTLENSIGEIRLLKPGQEGWFIIIVFLHVIHFQGERINFVIKWGNFLS